jgi:hypothetical protein
MENISGSAGHIQSNFERCNTWREETAAARLGTSTCSVSPCKRYACISSRSHVIFPPSPHYANILIQYALLLQSKDDAASIVERVSVDIVTAPVSPPPQSYNVGALSPVISPSTVIYDDDDYSACSDYHLDITNLKQFYNSSTLSDVWFMFYGGDMDMV